jgi:GT2 family glycosyltransferase
MIRNCQDLMERNNKFNYIVTIHNKEDLISDVLLGILKCASMNSNICLVIDGCTDKTEEIIDEVIVQNESRNIIKVYTDDVHELKAINAALRVLNQDGDGFNIILQDDVVLKEYTLESKISSLYEWAGDKLGIVSFRHGANLARFLLKKNFPVLPLQDYIESINGHLMANPNPLCLGEFIYKEIAIKSPICIPFYIVRNVGLPDEDFAPWDDINYCYQALLKGYNNGVFGIDFTSKVEWGTMRNKQQTIAHDAIIQRNLRLFKDRNDHFIKRNRSIYNSIIYSSLDDSTFKEVRKIKVNVERIINYVSKIKTCLIQGLRCL